MTTYTFQNLVDDPAIGDVFNPATDSLILDSTATGIRVLPRSTYTEFQKDLGGTIVSIRIAATAEQLDGGSASSAIVTSAGTIAFGDNSNAIDADPLGNNFTGQSSLVGGGDQYHGLSGADTFMGGLSADLAYGNKDNDVLMGGGGADSLYGGQGADYIEGWDATGATVGLGVGAISPAFTGGNTLTGGAAAEADAGDQLIYGNLQSDTQISGNGSDVHYGGQGDDVIFSFGGIDVVYGNKGDDYIEGGAGQDTLYGGQGADTIDGEGSTFQDDQTIYGNLDADTIYTGDGSDTVYGGQGDDVIYVRGHTVDSTGDKLIRGNKDNDLIDTHTTNDASGSDRLEGNGGDDTILAGGGTSGTDTVDGGTGADSIVGGDQASDMSGGDGNDVLRGGTAGDTMKGNTGNDTIYGGVDVTGAQYIHGGLGDDAIYLGGDTTTKNQTVFGGAGNDSLVGDLGGNELVGGSGGDTIVAGWYGSDTLDGSADADVDYFVWNSMAALDQGNNFTQTVKGVVFNTDTANGNAILGVKSNGIATNTQFWAYKAGALTKGTGGGSATGNATYGLTLGTAVGMDRVNNFAKGQDKLVFDGEGVFMSGTTINIVNGVSGGTGGKQILQVNTLKTTAAALSNVGTVGKFASRNALWKAMNTGTLKTTATTGGTITGAATKLVGTGKFVSSAGNATNEVFYAFAANTKATKLWVVQLNQADNAVTIDSGSILGTVHIPAGFQAGDIIVA